MRAEIFIEIQNLDKISKIPVSGIQGFRTRMASTRQ
ncbi:hypothetical protein BC659_2881 [Sediminibacterium goheungense]|uniref:Uncharacterized protein n=1 Tax=Sediminibacterium goheungense TaxID=1086393 RepID=A0A4R6ISY3_9BACT|nr:hypothetical protein BC659_2881 [Sediminibacterium goheungense]